MKKAHGTSGVFRVKEKKSYGILRDSIIHYVLAWLLLSFYGGKACPFVDGMQLQPTIITLGIILAVLYVLRSSAFFLFREKLVFASATAYYLFEVLFFVLWAVGGIVWGVNFYAFHAEGILKIGFGAIVPGLFFSMEMLNDRERYLIYRGKRQKFGGLERSRFFSLRKKIVIFGIVSIGLAGVAIILVTYKNFVWTARNIQYLSEGEVIASVLKEALFVIGTFLGLVVKLISSYSGNISLYFSLIMQVLDRLSEEKYDSRIPITSHDEFALLSHHINDITIELAEKQKIKGVFGKIVSPVIAERLLSKDHIELGGFEQELVILFADIRGFTAMTEQNDPQEIIGLLNKYHTAMVEIIHGCEGVVDKFIGDGTLAIFGLQDSYSRTSSSAVSNACKAAFLMQQALMEKISSDIRIGIGIHKGKAVAGLMGSPERLEFTVVGDTVNTASRLETATKDTGFDVLISEEAFLHLGESGTEWKDAGILHLKGKEHPIRAYGYTAPPSVKLSSRVSHES